MQPFFRLLAFCALVLSSGSTPFAHSAPLETKPRNVAVLIYDDVDPLDVSGPIDVFTTANEIAENSFHVYTVGVDEKLVAAKKGALSIKPQWMISNCPKPDIVVVPGASLKQMHALYKDKNLMDWLAHSAATCEKMMSVCTGAFLLGQAGLLKNRRATTHWFALDSFQAEFPKTTAIEGARFIEDGKFLSTAGVTSGIDGALQLVEKLSSAKVAETTARALQYRRNTPAYPETPMAKVELKPVDNPELASANSEKLASKFDPVCGMTINPKTKITHVHQGKTYGFCSPSCRKKFAANPQEYLK